MFREFKKCIILTLFKQFTSNSDTISQMNNLDNQIVRLPREIRGMVSLETLNLARNRLTDLPSEVKFALEMRQEPNLIYKGMNLIVKKMVFKLL